MLGKIVVSFVAVALGGVVFSAPSTHNDQSEPQSLVVRFENKSNETGKYSVIYELNNGIIHSESGGLSNGTDDQGIVEGSYWFTGPDNVTYMINYYADEDGFHPLVGSGAGVNFKVLASSVG